MLSFDYKAVRARIRVLIVDPYPVVRSGLKSVLARCFRIVGETDNGRDAVRLVHKLKPHVVITEIALPGLNGLGAARQIRDDHPETRVLLLSSTHDPYSIYEAMRSTVAGYLLKSDPLEDVAKAVRAVASGRRCYSAIIAEHIKRHGLDPDACKREPSGLTEREIQIIDLMVKEYTSKDIANELELSARTVERHKENIRDKLRVKSSEGIVSFGLRAGISQGRI